MGGGDKLAELAAELLLRGVDTDKVMAILGQAEPAPGRTARATGNKRGPKAGEGRVNYVTHEQVLGALAGSISLNVDQIIERLPGSNHLSVTRHLKRGTDMANILRVGKAEPYSYILTKSGRALVASGERTTRPGVGTAPPLRHDAFIAKFRELGPSTAKALQEATGASSEQAVRMHLKRGMAERTIVRHETDPLTWSAVGGKKKGKPTPAPGLTTRGTPRLRAPKSKLNHEELIAALKRLGPSDSDQIKAALGPSASMSAIRLHLQRAVREGTVLRHSKTRPITWGVLGTKAPAPQAAKGKPGRKPGKPGPTPAVRGENAALIVAALKAAGKPLDRAGFVAAVPKFKTMDIGAVYMALTNATKAGAIVRIGNGIYTLPGKAGAPAPKSQTPDGPKSQRPGNGSQQSLQLGSEPAKPPGSDRPATAPLN